MATAIVEWAPSSGQATGRIYFNGRIYRSSPAAISSVGGFDVARTASTLSLGEQFEVFALNDDIGGEAIDLRNGFSLVRRNGLRVNISPGTMNSVGANF